MSPEEFVSSLRARGVTLSVRGNRLRLDPGRDVATPDRGRGAMYSRAPSRNQAPGR